MGGTGGSGMGGGTSTEIDFDPSAVPEDDTSFPMGVQSGDLQSASGIFWTRYSGSNAVTLRVYIETTPGKVALYHEAMVSPDTNGFVHADIPGLPTLTELDYVFLEADGSGGFSGRSAIGRVVTPPAGNAKPVVRFGGVSCTGNNDNFPVLDQAAGEFLDFFLLVGDTVYADGSTTVADYRSVWEPQLTSGSYQALFQSTSTYATWDDHEVDNNWNPETVNQTRRDSAYQTFFEYLPIRKNATDP